MPSFSPTKKFPDEQIGSISIPVHGYVTQSEEETFQEIYGEYSKDVNALQILTDQLTAINQQPSQDNNNCDVSVAIAPEAEGKTAKIADLEAQINELLAKVKTNRFINKMVGFFLRSRVDPEWTDELVFELIPSFYTDKIYKLLTDERNSSFLQEPVLENQEIQNTSLTEPVEPTGQESN